ncbi:hypothetical protein BKA67DRAFT_513618, partial [Truncatella angustata]
QVAAAIQGFFWPKIFWDFQTRIMDILVTPLPILQVINLVCGVVVILWEWPWRPATAISFHRLIYSHILVLMIAALPAWLLYQGTNAAIYYHIGMALYLIALRKD